MDEAQLMGGPFTSTRSAEPRWLEGTELVHDVRGVVGRSASLIRPSVIR